MSQGLQLLVEEQSLLGRVRAGQGGRGRLAERRRRRAPKGAEAEAPKAPEKRRSGGAEGAGAREETSTAEARDSEQKLPTGSTRLQIQKKLTDCVSCCAAWKPGMTALCAPGV